MNRKIQYHLGIIILLAGTVFAQIRVPEYEIHDRGNLWETMKDDGTIGAIRPTDPSEFLPGMDWPGGPHQLTSKLDQRSYLYGAGLWIGGKHSDGSVFLTEHGPGGHVDQGSGYAITKVDNFIELSGYDPSQAEQTITATWINREDFKVKRTSRAWSFREYNNFIIIEYVLYNQNPGAVQDVYVGFPYLLRPSYQDVLVHNGWGDNVTDRADDIIRYDSNNYLIFSYDSTVQYDWDLGNYWPDYQELRSPGFAGFALLEADQATDGSPQPANVLLAHYMRDRLRLTLDHSSETALYALLSGTDQSLQIQPGELVVPFGMLSCGPYILTSGDSIQICLVEAVNGIAMEDSYDPDVAMLDIQNLYLSEGPGLLQTAIQNARSLYQNGYQFSELPPPSPGLVVYSNPKNQSIVLTWDPVNLDWSDPYTGKSTVKEWRIYRSDNSFIGPYAFGTRDYKRLRLRESDIISYYKPDLHKWLYEDRSINLGVGYYYAVTVVDSSGRESWYTNRNEYAVKSATLPAENALEVNVFPNPFREKSGIPTKGEANTITFTNLPATCVLRIYTVAGELVKTFKREDSLIGEESWDQLTDARQRTAPGIYFWTVDSEVGTAKGTLILVK